MDIDSMTEKTEQFKIESEYYSAKEEVESRKAKIRELKKLYGKNWKTVFQQLKENGQLKQLSKTSFRLI